MCGFKKYISTSLAIVLMLVSSISFVSAADIENSIIINGETSDIKLVHIDNERYLYTDSWYVPLRQVVETLGYTVNYDVSINKLAFEGEIQIFPDYTWRENLVTDSITSQIYGATINFNSNKPIIEIISPDGKNLYCQIGSESLIPFGSSPTPVIIDDTTYISIAVIDQIMANNSDDPTANISRSWNAQKHDTYYKGKTTWNSETNILIIDESANPFFENYNNSITILNSNGNKIIQRTENEKYAFCLIENNTKYKFVSIDKSTGKITDIEIGENISPLILMKFDAENPDIIWQYKIIDDEQSNFEPYKMYNLSEY